VRSRRTRSRKERLFECYAANLSALRPEYVDAFACPVCLRLLDREGLATGEITEDHIVPSSLRGRLVTLTCRDCNSEAGYSLESHLVRRLERDDFVSGVSKKPQPATVSIGDGEIAGEAFRYPDRIELHGILAISNPELHARAVSILDGGDVSDEVTLRLPLVFKGLPSWMAVLRMGYLLAFACFGYGYIMHPNVQQVREQIWHPDQQVLPTRAVHCLDQWPQAGNVLGLVFAPSRLRCFYAVVTVATETVRYFGVVLPGLDDQSLDIYGRWRDAPAPLADLRPRAAWLPLDLDRVCDPGNVGFASRLWSAYRKPLPTWAGRSEFHYDGSVDRGTDIWYGSKPHTTEVRREEYRSLLEHFAGRSISLGTSRQPPSRSVGAWLMEHVTKRAIASYVGPILVHEGYAERVPSDSTKIRFK